MFYMAVQKNHNERRCSYTWKSLKGYLERHQIEYVMNSHGWVRFSIETVQERKRIEGLLKQFERNIFVFTRQNMFNTSSMLKFD